MMKELLRPLLPPRVVSLLRRYRSANIDRRFEQLSPAEVFSEIYRNRMWGSSANLDFCSGQGSHHEQIVQPYVESVAAFLSSFSDLPNVVDLGCGDFNVGSKLRHYCGRYIATDVVPELIARNERLFRNLDVTFSCLDIVADELPDGDVAFLRQVAQHLSNAQVIRIVPKLCRYRWIVVSEHLPSTADFLPNRDKPAGPGVREAFGSGVVLSAPPFGLQSLEERELCTVPVSEQSGVVRTTAYRMSA